MKNFMKLLGIITMVTVIVFSMAACGGGAGGGGGGAGAGGGGVGGSLAAPKGKLTITGIPSTYNGEHIHASFGGGMRIGITGLNITNTTVTQILTPIIGGKAEVPLYELIGGPGYNMYKAYEGNDSAAG